MNRTFAITALSLACAASLAAQPMGKGPTMGRAPAAQPEESKTITVEGKLVFVDRQPSLQAKDKTYALLWPGFYREAYVDGIKEGATLKVEGYELPDRAGGDRLALAPTKVVAGAKTYEIEAGPGPAGRDDDRAGMGRGGVGKDDDRGRRGEGCGPMAGGPGGKGMGPGAGPAAGDAKAATIEGKLVIVDDFPAIQAKDKTYILSWQSFFYYAYFDGIKEGTQVKVTGFELPFRFPGQEKPFFAANEVTIGSKTYVVGAMGGRGAGPMQGPGPMGGRW